MNAERIIAQARPLRAPPETVVTLLSLLDSPDADYDQVVATVGRDAVLTAKLLALCNSASYGLAKPIASVDQGVLYLGFGEIHRIVMALGFGETISQPIPGYIMIRFYNRDHLPFATLKLKHRHHSK